MKLEYGLLVALMASVFVIGLNHVQTTIASPFDLLAEQMRQASELSGCDCHLESPSAMHAEDD